MEETQLECLSSFYIVTAHPWYFFHFVYCYGAGLIYLIFSLIYFYVGGTNVFGDNFIYEILDWDNPGKAVSIALGVSV